MYIWVLGVKEQNCKEISVLYEICVHGLLKACLIGRQWDCQSMKLELVIS